MKKAQGWSPTVDYLAGANSLLEPRPLGPWKTTVVILLFLVLPALMLLALWMGLAQ